MILPVSQYWMDGAQNIHYGRLPKSLINTYSDVLFWQWFHDETKGARLHKGSLEEIKKYWYDNIFITASPEVDNASDLTMGMIGASYISQPPNPPVRLELKYKIEPSAEILWPRSSAGLLMIGPRFLGGNQGSFFLGRLVIHMSIPPNPPGRGP